MTEKPTWMDQVLGWAGVEWPDGNPFALGVLGDHWLKYSGEVSFQLTRAREDVKRTLETNQSTAVKAFEEWWGRAHGPNLNLDKLVSSAESLCSALKVLAAQIAIAQFALIVKLGVVVAGLIAAGYLIATAGGILAMTSQAAGGEFVRSIIKGAFVVGIAALAWHFQGEIAEFIKKATEVEPAPEVKVEPAPRPRPQRLPDAWMPQPEVRPDDEPRYQPCYLSPDVAYQTQFYGKIRNYDVYGDGIVSVFGHEFRNGVRMVQVYGVVHPVLPERQRFEKHWDDVRVSMGLPAETYDGAHLVGRLLGGEVGDGILLADRRLNRGPWKRIEEYAADMSENIRNEGGYLEFVATGWSHPYDAWIEKRFGGDTMRTGYNLAARASYTLTPCFPNPNGDGTYYPGHSETYWVAAHKPDPNGYPYENGFRSSPPLKPPIPMGRR